jgi:hypothetical protein
LPMSRTVYVCKLLQLAVIRKRRLLDVRREGCGGLAEFQTKVVEVTVGRRMGAEFVDGTRTTSLQS